MTREEATGIAYDSSLAALTKPGSIDNFFQLHEPQSKAAWCAEFSRLAYCALDRALEPALARVGFTLLAPFDRSGTQGFLAQGPDFAVLAIRGSDDLDAWITNLNALPAPWRGEGEVHRGFAEALEDIWAEVETALSEVDRPLFVTGHSLGAALATLAARLLAGSELMTFGSPRVGTEDFQAAFEARPGTAQRYVNNRDLVCHVPPYEVGYRHVGRPYLIDAAGQVSQGDTEESGLLDLISRTLRGGLLRGARGDGLPREASDHAPINYVSALL